MGFSFFEDRQGHRYIPGSGKNSLGAISRNEMTFHRLIEIRLKMIESYSREQENYGETDGIVIVLTLFCQYRVRGWIASQLTSIDAPYFIRALLY
jgi:hypothetical protein